MSVWHKTNTGILVVNYKNEFKEQLKNARSYTAEQLAELHVNFGRMMGAEVKKFIAKNCRDYCKKLLCKGISESKFYLHP